MDLLRAMRAPNVNRGCAGVVVVVVGGGGGGFVGAIVLQGLSQKWQRVQNLIKFVDNCALKGINVIIATLCLFCFVLSFSLLLQTDYLQTRY